MDYRKLRAVFIAAMLIFNAYGIIWGFTAQYHFAQAANDTYTVRNIIYINATGLSKAPSDIIRLEIAESIEMGQDAKPPMPVKAIDDRSFSPDTTTKFSRFIKSLYERQDLGSSFEFAGQQYVINTSVIEPAYLFAGQLGNGTILPVNMSAWIDAGFETPYSAYPAAEKLLVFDSPLHYAVQYCADHGLIFRNIVNSTYQRTYDMTSLNHFQSKLLKEDMIIYNTNTSVTMAMSKAAQYGSALIPQALTGLEIVLIVVAVLGFISATGVIVTWLNNEYALKGLKTVTEGAAKSLADSVNATKQIADSLAGDRANERAMVLEFFNNGTITWEQMNFLLQTIDNSYNPLINNCTANIAAMTAAYFNSTVELYGEYTNGLMDATSWTSWITPLITLIITCIVAYIVYALVSKIKGASTPATSINVTKL